MQQNSLKLIVHSRSNHSMLTSCQHSTSLGGFWWNYQFTTHPGKVYRKAKEDSKQRKGYSNCWSHFKFITSQVTAKRRVLSSFETKKQFNQEATFTYMYKEHFKRPAKCWKMTVEFIILTSYLISATHNFFNF